MSKLTICLAAVVSSTSAGCAIDSNDTDSGDTPHIQAHVAKIDPAAERHCVLQTETGMTSCFESFPEAVRLATGGRISDAPMDAHAAFTDPAFRDRLDALTPTSGELSTNLHNAVWGSGTVLAIQFSDANYTGSELFIEGFEGCIERPQVAVMPADWNDEISSFWLSRGCKEVLYADGNFSGRSITSSVSLPYVGDAMNDEASTIRLFPIN